MLIWKNKLAIFGIISMLAMTSSCSLKTIKEQSQELENVATIKGTVNVDGQSSESIVVAALTYHSDNAVVVSQSRVDKKGTYQLYLLPDTYLIGAYIDKNNNLKRDVNESSVMFSQDTEKFTYITLTNKQKLTLAPMTINPKTSQSHHTAIHYNHNKTKENLGRVLTLEDPMFAKEYSEMGLWRPLDFLEQVGGGLLFLQPYDKHKTPVLFVHGLSGNPSEFKHIIGKLDHDKFQPWVLYYPSGLPLNLVSNYMVNTLAELQKKHSFTDIQLISHSMGGLIAREFLILQQQQKLAFDTSLYVTINSPMYGLDNAARGVNESPIVIASWRDLASHSDYVNSLHQWTIPKSIPYHLFFSYLADNDGDGNVPMRSQLSLSLQNEATRIYGTQGSHVGVMSDDDFINRLLKVIESPQK